MIKVAFLCAIPILFSLPQQDGTMFRKMYEEERAAQCANLKGLKEVRIGIILPPPSADTDEYLRAASRAREKLEGAVRTAGLTLSASADAELTITCKLGGQYGDKWWTRAELTEAAKLPRNGRSIRGVSWRYIEQSGVGLPSPDRATTADSFSTFISDVADRLVSDYAKANGQG